MVSEGACREAAMDTHTLLWYAINEPQLSNTAVAAILDPQNEVYMSAVSHWEMAIKISLGKLQTHTPFREFLDVFEHQYHISSSCCRSCQHIRCSCRKCRFLRTIEIHSIECSSRRKAVKRHPLRFVFSPCRMSAYPT